MSVPRSYVVPQHLMVTPDVAPRLHALLADERRRTRTSGRELDERLCVFLADLDAMVDARAVNQSTPRSRWVTTTEARERLGLGTNRAVLQLGERRRWLTRMNRGRREFLEADVIDEAELRGVA